VGGYQTNSFLEDSYSKNATNHFQQQLKRDDISFDSNQFSQTGTPSQFMVKLPGNAVKKINIVGREVIQGVNQNAQNVIPPVLKATSSIERKPKKIVLQGHHPHTTGMVTK